MPHHPADRNPLPPEGADPQAGLIVPRDAVSLLRLLGSLGTLRNDPRAWRNELLQGINRLFPADGAVAFILKNVRANHHPTVISLFEGGFRSPQQRTAYADEINAAPLRDPLSLAVLHRFTTRDLDTLTCLRADVVHDLSWAADPDVQRYRTSAGLGDCIFSLHRGTDRSIAYALCVHRRIASRVPEGATLSGRPAPTDRFTDRERLLLDTLHRGLDWLYTAEESAHKLNRASAMAPRLRQTLEYLLAGASQRQIAAKMDISVHTVHGYVKSLYRHFGVSSRTELMSRWVKSGGQVGSDQSGGLLGETPDE